MNPVVVLGATGSIGRQCLDVAARLDLRVSAISARRASEQLAELAEQWPEAAIVAVDPDPAGHESFTSRFGSRYRSGADAQLEIVAAPDVTVVNGVVGAAGLDASVATLVAGNRLGLANKESLVAGGPLVLDALRRGGGELIPIDSEHSALFQCLVGEDPAEIDRLVLTASGGPFRGWSADQLESVTRAQALAHPTWNMGPRITIDSATLANKGLEVIEAHFLFGLEYDRIDVVVHPQSTVHSMIEFVDGSLKAHLGATDMRIPIQYALTYPARAAGPVERFDLTGRSLDFEAPDIETFRALGLAFAAGRAGGTHPAVFNAADEVAVAAFLDGLIGFPDIAGAIDHALTAHDGGPADSIESVWAADAWARQTAETWVRSR